MKKKTRAKISSFRSKQLFWRHCLNNRFCFPPSELNRCDCQAFFPSLVTIDLWLGSFIFILSSSREVESEEQLSYLQEWFLLSRLPLPPIFGEANLTWTLEQPMLRTDCRRDLQVGCLPWCWLIGLKKQPMAGKRCVSGQFCFFFAGSFLKILVGWKFQSIFGLNWEKSIRRSF